MMKKGLLDIDDLRVIWQSELIINGPHVVRKDLPESLKEELKYHNINLYYEDKVCFETITSGEFWIVSSNENFSPGLGFKLLIRAIDLDICS